MGYSVILTRDHDGRRIDHTIKSIWPNLPVSAVMRALRKGEIRVDSVKVHEPSARVYTGQELYTPWPLNESKNENNSDLNLDLEACPALRTFNKKSRNWGTVPVIWRGDGAIVINKPSGLLVQPDVKHGDSVITRIWGMLNNENNESDENKIFKAAAVHRLDRNTTGVLIAALHGDALRALELLFKERRVKKFYRAIVSGRAPDFVEINAPLLKDADLNLVKVSHDGKSAVTRCKLLDYDDTNNISLVELELLTGRTHQARVHTAHIGHAILGDRKYGNFSMNKHLNKNIKRPLLHAFRLVFPDYLPDVLKELSGKTFEAAMPHDMLKFFN